MTGLASWILVPLGAVVFVACDGAKTSHADAGSHTSSASAPAPESPAPIDDADAAPIAAGPVGPDAAVSTEERERAVLALLAGGAPANRLPRAAVDPGHDFDPAQRDRVDPPSRPPVVRVLETSVTGPLPEEVIHRIVRQNAGRFVLCYENGLRTTPGIGGEVVVHFVIDKTGSVESQDSQSSTLTNKAIVACVVRAFGGLSFPEPPNKTKVQVRETLLFESGEPE
jgi:hypothetical protein